MARLSLTDGELAVLGLASVAVGTVVFTGAARRLSWRPLAISLTLFGAGRIASLW
jgi:hypothetical protein